MNKYKCIDDSNYEVLQVGKIYSGIEEAGTFSNWPYLRVFDDNGKQIAAAYLSRFEKVE